MRSKSVLALLVGLGAAAVAACTDVPFGPEWNSDFFFPIQFADVVLGGNNGVAPGGIIPPANVSSTSTVSQQDITGTTKQILDEDVNSIKADIIFATSADLTGSIQISVAPNQADLFSSNPALALTTTIPIKKTAGDTTHVDANVNVFRTSQQSFGNNNNAGSSANVLYSQSKTTVACRSGLCPVSASDKLQLGINLTVNVAVVTRSK
jgi:hypothetical protein